MISAILINPQVFYKDGQPYKFSQDCIFSQNGVDIDRVNYNFPWEKTDAEVEAFILSKCEEKALEINGGEFMESLSRWDWPTVGPDEIVNAPTE